MTTRDGTDKPALVRSREGSFRFHEASRLYLDDVEQLYGLLMASCRSIKIEADGYEIPDPSALGELGPLIRNFTITSSDPIVALTLAPREVSTYCHDIHDTVAYGLFNQLQDLIRLRHAPLAWLRQWHFYVLQWVLIAASWLVPRGIGKDLALLLSFVPIVGIVFLLRRDSRKGLVMTARSTARVPWIDRNRDALVVAAVSAVLGAVIGYVLTRTLG